MKKILILLMLSLMILSVSAYTPITKPDDTASLKAIWYLDESGATTTAQDGSVNNMDISDADINANNWVAGKFGNGFYRYQSTDAPHSGTTDYFIDDDTFSMDFWMYPYNDFDTYASDEWILGEFVSGTGGWVIKSDADSTNKLQLTLVEAGTGTSRSSYCNKTSWSANTWYHVYMYVDADGTGSVTCFINGVDESSGGTFNYNMDNTGGDHFAINEDLGTGVFFSGIMDDVGIYTTALDPTCSDTTVFGTGSTGWCWEGSDEDVPPTITWTGINNNSILCSGTSSVLLEADYNDADNDTGSVYFYLDGNTNPSTIVSTNNSIASGSTVYYDASVTDGVYYSKICVNNSENTTLVCTGIYKITINENDIIPVINLSYPFNNYYTKNNTVNFKYVIDESCNVINCSLLGGTTTLSVLNTSSSIVDGLNNLSAVLPEGNDEYLWNIKCVVSDGNISYHNINYTLRVNNRSDVFVADYQNWQSGKYSTPAGTYSMWNLPQAIKKNDVTFFVYGGNDTNAYVSSFHNDYGTFDMPVMIHSIDGDDAHVNPTLMIDEEGYLNVFYGGHSVYNISFKRSTYPYNINYWNSQVNITPTVNSYPQAYTLENGNYILFSRGVDGQETYVTSSNHGSTWGSSHDIISVDGGVYLMSLQDKDDADTIYFAWTMENTIRNDVHFAWTNNGGVSLINVSGSSQSVPLTSATTCKAYDSGTNHINLDGFQVDSNKRPIILFHESGCDGSTYEDNNCSQTWRVAHWNGTVWNVVNVSDIYHGDRNYDEGNLVYFNDSDVRAYVPSVATIPYEDGGDIQEFKSTNLGLTWVNTKNVTVESGLSHNMIKTVVNGDNNFNLLWSFDNSTHFAGTSVRNTARLYYYGINMSKSELVYPPDELPPIPILNSPANGTVYGSRISSVQLNASVYDPNGDSSMIYFYADQSDATTLVSSFSLASGDSGSYSVSTGQNQSWSWKVCVNNSNNGTLQCTDVRNFFISDDTAPVVTLNIANLTTYKYNTTQVNLNATYYDFDGDAGKIYFYADLVNGSTLVSTQSTVDGAYTYVYSVAQNKTYFWKACVNNSYH